MGLVHDDENAPPAANELVPRDLVDLDPFRRLRDVVEGDVELRKLIGGGVDHVLDEVGRKALWCVVDVVSVPEWFAAKDGDERFGVSSKHVQREFEVQELVVKEPTIGMAESGAGPMYRIFKGPIQLENKRVLRTMAPVPFLSSCRLAADNGGYMWRASTREGSQWSNTDT